MMTFMVFIPVTGPNRVLIYHLLVCQQDQFVMR
jgi:hypothetical protein